MSKCYIVVNLMSRFIYETNTSSIPVADLEGGGGGLPAPRFQISYENEIIWSQ